MVHSLHWSSFPPERKPSEEGLSCSERMCQQFLASVRSKTCALMLTLAIMLLITLMHSHMCALFTLSVGMSREQSRLAQKLSVATQQRLTLLSAANPAGPAAQQASSYLEALFQLITTRQQACHLKF